MAEEEEPTYPEGGIRAYLVVLGSLCGMFAGFGLMNTISVFNAYMSSHQLKEYDSSSISWIFSLYIFMVFFCGLQIGPIFDHYGPRALIVAGTAFLVVGVLSLSVCNKYWQFIFAFSLCSGLGSSLLFTPSVAAISHFFNAKRGTATGFAATGGSLGGIVFPLMLQSLIPKVGWAWSTRILAFLMLFLCSIAILLVRGRVKELKETAERAVSTQTSSNLEKPIKTESSWRDVIPQPRIFFDGTGALALTTAGIFFLEWGLFVPLTYLTTFAMQAGISDSLSYNLIAVFNAGSVFGRFLPGLIADRIGRFNAMIITACLCLVAVVAFWIPSTSEAQQHASEQTVLGLFIPFCILFGFASGSGISLSPVCVGELCATRNYGRYYATCYTVVSFGCLTGLPIAGTLLKDDGGQFWGALAFTGVSYVLAIICFMAVKIRKCGWDLKIRW